MTDKLRHIVVGLTALAALAGLGALLMLFGYVPDFLERGYSVKVNMLDAGGLTVGSRVKLNGLDVGRVLSIELKPKVNEGVIATILIRDEFDIPRGVSATVSQSLIGGSPSLILDATELKDAQQLAPLDRTGGESIAGSSASLTGQLAGQLQAAFDGPKRDLHRLVNNFEALSKEWTEVGKNVREMTAPRPPADVDGSNGAKLANVTTVLARADARLAEMKQALDGINAWVNDAKLREDVKVAVANVRDTSASIKDAAANIKDVSADAKQFTGRLSTSLDKVDSLVDTARTDVDQLTKRYVAVADDLSKAIQSARLTMDAARDGDGTVGKLIKDPALYNNLNDSVKRLDSALIDMKLLIQKWEKEGIIRF